MGEIASWVASIPQWICTTANKYISLAVRSNFPTHYVHECSFFCTMYFLFCYEYILATLSRFIFQSNAPPNNHESQKNYDPKKAEYTYSIPLRFGQGRRCSCTGGLLPARQPARTRYAAALPAACQLKNLNFDLWKPWLHCTALYTNNIASSTQCHAPPM